MSRSKTVTTVLAGSKSFDDDRRLEIHGGDGGEEFRFPLHHDGPSDRSIARMQKRLADRKEKKGNRKKR